MTNVNRLLFHGIAGSTGTRWRTTRTLSVKTLAHPGDLLEVRLHLGYRIVDRPEEHPDQEPRDAAEEEKIHENGRERLRPVFVDCSDTDRIANTKIP